MSRWGAGRPGRAPGGARSGRGALGTSVPVLGLIGPIGCGKSTVAGWLAEEGAVVLDADELTRTAMEPGTPLTESSVSRFGAEFRRPDGSLDREALGWLVFSDPARLAELESLVHPAVERLEREAIRAADMRRPPAIVLEAIKHVEAGHAAWCDQVWLVICEPALQFERLVGRGMAPEDARQRVAAQAVSMPLWRSAATRTIRTDGTMEEVRVLVAEAFAELRARAGR